MARKPLLPREEYLRRLPKRRVSAGAMILNPQGDAVLMVKPWYKDYWTLPGGVVDAGESPQTACQREVEEELGFTPTQLRFVGLGFVRRTGPVDEVVHVYFAAEAFAPDRVQALPFDRDELDAVRFVPLDELSEYAKGQFAVHLASLIRAARQHEPHYFEDLA